MCWNFNFINHFASKPVNTIPQMQLENRCTNVTFINLRQPEKNLRKLIEHVWSLFFGNLYHFICSFSEGLKLGASKHWTHTLKAITGETELTAKALLEYFEPLQKFLKEENRRLEKEDEVRQILEQHNVVASDQCTKLVTAEWNVETDINNKTKQELLAQAVAENARFTKEQFDTHFRNLSQISFVDEKIQRQVLYLSKLGVDILDENRMSELLNVRKNMERVYSNAKFCDYGKPNCNLDTEGLTLDPGMYGTQNSMFHSMSTMYFI